MKKVNIIRKNEDFDRIIKKRSSFSSPLFIINIEKKEKTIPQFGITFVKKIGNAVTRNKLKRQVKSIIDNHKNYYQIDYNYIIIIKKDAVLKSFKELEEDLISLFLKIKEKNNGKQS